MTWRVPYVDYPSQFRKHESEIMGTIHGLLTQGDLMLRQQLCDFESNLAAFCGTRYAVGVSNCTDGLRLILQALGIGTGDEVITVSHTFVATVSAIHHSGATPVLVDIGEDHLMDVACVEQAITARTKAIIPVQLNGRVCDMQALQALANTHDLVIVEDAAQALGAKYDGIKAGAFGAAAAFSFYPAKLLGAYGDGGAVTTSDQEIAERILLLRDHGRNRGEIVEWAFNCRLDNLQAAILDLKLKRFPEAIQRRRQIATVYHRLLADEPRLTLPRPPEQDSAHYDVFQNFEIEVEDRDALEAYLTEKGIETMRPWGGKGVHQFKALCLTHFHLPRTDRLFRRALMLPMHTELTDQQVEYTAESVKAFLKQKAVVRRDAA